MLLVKYMHEGCAQAVNKAGYAPDDAYLCHLETLFLACSIQQFLNSFFSDLLLGYIHVILQYKHSILCNRTGIKLYGDLLRLINYFKFNSSLKP